MGMTIGSHTSLHVRVDKMKDAKMMDAEVRGSREALKKHVGADAAFLGGDEAADVAGAGEDRAGGDGDVAGVRAVDLERAALDEGGEGEVVRRREDRLAGALAALRLLGLFGHHLFTIVIRNDRGLRGRGGRAGRR